MTAEEIREAWRLGDYTSSGYLYHLICALRRDGRLRQNDTVSEFCREWEMNRRSFYKAKAKLIDQGRLEAQPAYQIALRVPVMRVVVDNS